MTESSHFDDFTPSKISPFQRFSPVSESAIRYNTRAKFYPTPDGGARLAEVQNFSTAKFTPDGWETIDSDAEFLQLQNLPHSDLTASPGDELPAVIEIPKADVLTADKLANIRRAVSRSKINAFDAIMCNYDLDLFATITYSPDAVSDKADYDECYKYLDTFLRNRVSRRGLKYVCVPERTKKGDIHFHMITNSTAHKLTPAVSPYTGKPLLHRSKPLFNIADWERGFSSAELIPADIQQERDAVSKYMFKYMGKQSGQKIGGRYVLMGGKLARPFYRYGDDPAEFMPKDSAEAFHGTVAIPCGSGKLTFEKWTFI